MGEWRENKGESTENPWILLANLGDQAFLVRSHLAIGDRLVIVPTGKKEVNISLETRGPSKNQDSAVSKKSPSRKRHHTRWVRVLFPSPLFVAP